MKHVLERFFFLFTDKLVFMPTHCLGRVIHKQFFILLSFLQIFDASTNKWKLVDEKQHTDVYEKITEMDEKEDLKFRRNITDETNIINNTERNLLQENLNEKHTRTTDLVDYIRSDHLIDESVSSSDLVNQVVIKEDVRTRKDTKVSIFDGKQFGRN